MPAACRYQQKSFGGELRERRAGEAPNALRTATSRLRPSMRTSNKLVTLTQAISSRSPAPLSRIRSKNGRMSPEITFAERYDFRSLSFVGVRILLFQLLCNPRLAFESAVSRVTPSLSRATP